MEARGAEAPSPILRIVQRLGQRCPNGVTLDQIESDFGASADENEWRKIKAPTIMDIRTLVMSDLLEEEMIVKKSGQDTAKGEQRRFRFFRTTPKGKEAIVGHAVT